MQPGKAGTSQLSGALEFCCQERGLETLFALQPSQEQWFVAVERSHEVGDVRQRGTWHNKSRLEDIINLATFF